MKLIAKLLSTFKLSLRTKKTDFLKNITALGKLEKRSSIKAITCSMRATKDATARFLIFW